MTKVTDELANLREREQISRSTTRIMGGEDGVDQEARDAVLKVGARMDSHEVLCTERWGQLRAAVAEVKAKVDKSIGYIPAALIAALTGICGFLADRAFPLH
jgi:hypothetical protein